MHTGCYTVQCMAPEAVTSLGLVRNKSHVRFSNYIHIDLYFQTAKDNLWYICIPHKEMLASQSLKFLNVCQRILIYNLELNISEKETLNLYFELCIFTLWYEVTQCDRYARYQSRGYLWRHLQTKSGIAQAVLTLNIIFCSCFRYYFWNACCFISNQTFCIEPIFARSNVFTS